MAIFDLYTLFISVFGSLFLAIIGVTVLFLIVIAFAKLSQNLMLCIIGAWLTIVALFFASWTAVIIAAFAIFYFFMEVTKFVTGN